VTVPLRTAFELGLRGSRMPLDLALRVTGRADSIHELWVDRAEAGVRTAVGAVLGDEELSEQGRRGLEIARAREDAARARREAAELDGWTT
jgi:hypothetical protein